MAIGSGERTDEIVYRALHVPCADRAAFVRRACGGDRELRHEVGSLLAAAEAMDESFLEHSLPAELPERRETGENRRLGAYRLRREIGRGGMGRVYLAERADGEYEQEVAIKILKRGFDTDELIRRFRRERQILARLDHPWIARLLDGGTTGEGLPYLVMELVRGQPIDRYCESRRLGTGARVELVREVCSAVHFAHRHRVVHRDLKPAKSGRPGHSASASSRGPPPPSW